MPPRPVDACRGAGGVARTSTLMSSGLSKAALRDAVASGQLLRLRQGVYGLPDTPAAVREAVSHRGKVACVTAARRFGLWTLDDGADAPAHVWADPERHRTGDDECGCTWHRDAACSDSDLVTVGIAHCLVQIAWCRGGEPFFCALESALRQRMLSAADRRLIREGVPHPLRWLVDFARDDADSGLESLIRLRLHLRGIDCATQIAVPGVGVVDLGVGDCLLIEADGQTHGGDGRHRDLIRDAVAMSHGFVTLRFDAAMILHEWEVVEAAILAAVSRGLHESDLGRRVRAGF
ncbi:type IV toxin-antitoxin system AbiEi family antitoxin domain-containing protein [Microbacterium sp. RD1]|uniref:type IV toxin-antitoxin system AbiEi family antitoxin domain-containing protein n=1 Tax=Microbacterium sp. RD1 TaxID=3457313 RepID=UPI003FA56600